MRFWKKRLQRVAAMVCSVALVASMMPTAVFAAESEATTPTTEPLAAVTSLEESGEEKAPEQGETGIRPEAENACTKSEDCAAETHEEGCPKYVAPAEEEDTDPVVSCTKSEDCAAETHEEGCPKYVAPDEDEVTEPAVSCTKDENCAAETHEEDCPKYVAPAEEEDTDPVVSCTKSEDCAAETHEEGCPKYVAPEGEDGAPQVPDKEDSQDLPQTAPSAGSNESAPETVSEESDNNLAQKDEPLDENTTPPEEREAEKIAVFQEIEERNLSWEEKAALLQYTNTNQQPNAATQRLMTSALQERAAVRFAEPAKVTYTKANDTTVYDEVTLEEAVNALNAAGGGVITVTQSGYTSTTSLSITSDITIQADSPVTIGYAEGQQSYGSLFTLRSGATLTLGKGDNAEDLLTVDGSGGSERSTMFYLSSWETHKLSLNIRDGVILTGATGPVVDIYTASENTTLNMTGGQIINNNASDTLICVGHFNMSGGKIAHNRVYDEGATGAFGYAVIFAEDNIRIEGDALIEDCHAGPFSGAAIRLTSASDCYIGGNAIIRDCTGMNGGAIEVDGGSADVTIEGDAQIINCHREETAQGAYRYMGGAIYFSSSGTLTIQGNARIEGCSSPVAGAIVVYNDDETSQCIIKGNAQIVGNTGNYGGAIFAQSGARVEVSENATISGNTAKIAGGGIVEMMFGYVSILGEPVIPEVSLKGGKITGNKAPMGAGVCVAGASEAWEWFGNDIKNSYMELMKDYYEDQYGDPAELEKKLEEVSQAYDDSVVTGPCVLNIADGASVTGNTATEQGGGIWVGWDVSPKISGAIHVTGNTLENGTANDIYLDRDPDAPEDPVVPEWPEEPEEPVEPGNEPSFEEFLEFVHTLAAQTAKDALEAASDSEVVQSAQFLGYLPKNVTADDLSSEKMTSLRDWLEEQLIIAQSNNLIFEDNNIIAQYKNTYNAKPSLDVFKQTAKVVYEDYVVFDTKAFLIGWTFDKTNAVVVEVANELGLTVEDGSYTGTEEQFWQAYKAYAVEDEFGEVTDEKWQAAYDKASEEKEEPEEPEEPVEVRDGRLAVTGALTGSKIGVFVEGERTGRVFAYGNEYTLTPEDLAVFTVENPGYIGAGTVANTLVLKRPVVDIAPADPPTPPDGNNNSNNNNTNNSNTTKTNVVNNVSAPAAPAKEAEPAAAPAVTTVAIPQTGDESQPLVWVTLLVLSGAALAALAVFRKKRSDK